MISLSSISFLRYFVLILIHICLVLSRVPVSNTFVTKLIHYLATDSPFFDPTKTIWELAQSDLENSMRRAAYLTANSSLPYGAEKDVQLVGVDVGYLARIQVGSESLYQLVFMDTGSSLLWINCVPSGSRAREPVFDPESSTSFGKSNCNSGICSKTGGVQVHCNNNNNCTYLIRYASSHSEGFLARETFIFGDQIFKNILFGCSNYSPLTRANGMLGLGGNHLSLVAQMSSSKFSYCLGNVTDVTYPYSSLAIGEQLPNLGKKIPLIIEDKYYINLEGIIIDFEDLHINPKNFRRNSADYFGGMMVDSGTTYTYIPRVAFNKVKKRIINLIDDFYNSLSRNDSMTSRGEKLVCYNGISSRDLEFFPTMKFRFEGGAILELGADNIFNPLGQERFCLAMLPTESVAKGNTVSILGIVMQQYFYVSFDLKERFVAFERKDCGEYIS